MASISYLGSAVSMALGPHLLPVGSRRTDHACVAQLCVVAGRRTPRGARALSHGEVDLALTGGVSTVLSPGVTREMADLGLLSSKRPVQRLRCRGGRVCPG